MSYAISTRPLRRKDLSDANPVFVDPVMASVIARAARAARSDASVLICGESGTGKEVLARFIHANSPRAARPFVGVNCAALPATLLEAELFGHEKGAFSGALRLRIGKFEAANTGSLLLDEITEVEYGLQAKLLRAIQEREIDRIGGFDVIPIDVRVIATTNRDIAREVAERRFRDDLFYRLNVLPVTIPSLRERPRDIGPLADRFLKKYQGDDLPKALSPAAQSLLHSYHWPGNVRELENAIRRAIVLTDDLVIEPDALEISLDDPVAAVPPCMAIQGVTSLDDMEREAILAALRVTGGNRTKAANALGISARTLRSKLSRYRQAA